MNKIAAQQAIPTDTFVKFAQDVALTIWDSARRNTEPIFAVECAVVGLAIVLKNHQPEYAVVPKLLEFSEGTGEAIVDAMHANVRELARSDGHLVALFVVTPVDITSTNPDADPGMFDRFYVAVQGATIDLRTCMFIVESTEKEVFNPHRVLPPEEHKTNPDEPLLADLWLTYVQERKRMQNVILH